MCVKVLLYTLAALPACSGLKVSAQVETNERHSVARDSVSSGSGFFTTSGVDLPEGVQIDVRDKVVIVTGASSGIGRIAAKQFAHAGMRVVATGRRIEALEKLVHEIKSSGGEAIPVKQDVASEQDHISVMQAAEQSFGGVDFVFANAGWEGTGGIEHSDLQSLKKLLETNVLGTWLSLKHAMPSFRKRNGGAFVIVSSMYSSLKPEQINASAADAISLYLSTKAALDGWSRAAGFAYLPQHARVYNIKPGYYASEILERHGGLDSFAPGEVGNPRFLADVALAMFDNSTRWRPGQLIACIGDATVPAQVFNEILDDGTRWGQSKCKIEKSLCNAKGGPYTFHNASATMLDTDGWKSSPCDANRAQSASRT
jgi:NAD(P)-dependent dehydrogenase (short-subunit alcohol dehydrogenase family)